MKDFDGEFSTDYHKNLEMLSDKIICAKVYRNKICGYITRSIKLKLASEVVESEITAEIDSKVTAEVDSKVTAEVDSKVTAEVDSKVTAEVDSKVTAEVESETVSDSISTTVDSKSTDIKKSDSSN